MASFLDVGVCKGLQNQLAVPGVLDLLPNLLANTFSMWSPMGWPEVGTVDLECVDVVLHGVKAEWLCRIRPPCIGELDHV